MLGKNIDTLKLLNGEAAKWRQAGLTQGVVITQINAVMPDGKSVTLFWDAEEGDWQITTSST